MCLNIITTEITIGEYLIQQLSLHGVRHIIGMLSSRLVKAQVSVIFYYDEKNRSLALREELQRIEFANILLGVLLPRKANLEEISRKFKFFPRMQKKSRITEKICPFYC